MLAIRKLTQDDVKARIAEGGNCKINDGGSLFLYVKKGRGFFIHNYRDGDKIRSHSIGPAGGDNALTLAAARRARDAFMVDLREGRPLAIRERKATADRFGDALAAYLETHAKIPAPTRSLAAKYIKADFRAKSVHNIKAEDVRDALMGKDEKGKSIWTGPGPNRGNRLRLLMLGVFAAKGVRPNPAEWNAEGAQLPHLMTDEGRERTAVTNWPSMPYAELPAFIATLGDSIEDRAGRFVILTAVRRKEALAATWGEFDFANRVWTIPGERMKMGRPHDVPLTDAMIDALGKPGGRDAYVFQNKAGGPLSDSHAALDKTWLPNGYTLHGFRSTFATWAAEQDHGRAYPFEVREAALAHAKANAVVAAYERSNQLEARRELMQAWSDHVTGGQTR